MLSLNRRTGMPAASELSRQTWVGERVAGLLPELASRIVDLAGPHAPRMLFLGGSAVHGELCGIIDPAGRRHFLSDLDLGILTERRVSEDEARRIRSKLEVTTGGPEARLGFYLLADFHRQDSTPGFVETVRKGFVLFGDALNFSLAGPLSAGKVPRGEACRLMSNRAVEWIAASAGPETSGLDRVYAAAKFHADMGSVYLIADGAYRGGGYAERLEHIDACRIAPEARSLIEAWTAWRLDPQWGAVPGFGGVTQAAGSTELAGGLALAARWALRSISGGDSIACFLDPARSRGRAWARSWRRWVRGGEASFSRLRPSDFLRTPRLLLWESALELVLHPEGGTPQPLTRLSGEDLDRASCAAGEIARLGNLMSQEGIE